MTTTPAIPGSAAPRNNLAGPAWVTLLLLLALPVGTLPAGEPTPPAVAALITAVRSQPEQIATLLAAYQGPDHPLVQLLRGQAALASGATEPATTFSR